MASSTAPQRKASVTGLAACLVGAVMLLVQVGVLAAVALGVKDNQGTIYAISIPFVMYLLGVPLGLLLAGLGLAQPERKKSPAVLGIVLTLSGPALFWAAWTWNLMAG